MFNFVVIPSTFLITNRYCHNKKVGAQSDKASSNILPLNKSILVLIMKSYCHILKIRCFIYHLVLQIYCLLLTINMINQVWVLFIITQYVLLIIIILFVNQINSMLVFKMEISTPQAQQQLFPTGYRPNKTKYTL